MNSMTITVQLLQGDIVQVHLPAGGDFYALLYNEVLPEAPLGCIVLRTLEGEEVTQLADGITVTAWVNPSCLDPHLERLSHKIYAGNTENSWMKPLDLFRISFYKDSDEGGSYVASSVDLVYDPEDNAWAFRHDLVPLKSHRRYIGAQRVQYPRSADIWHEDLSACLLATTERIPKDEETLRALQSQLDNLPEDEDEDEDDVVDYSYPDPADVRQEYYEEHIRWARRHGYEE